jgi:UDP-GlcNAc:undecaprenyl-phosphate/decaprenyl-phosphate GlcNAc-1-phosphate transferase
MIDNFILYTIILIINFFFLKNFKKIKFFFINIDLPDHKRKIHKIPIALAGGTILMINLSIITTYDLLVHENNQYIILYLTSLLIFLLGFYDDKNNLSYKKKFFLLTIIFSFCYFLDENFQIRSLYIETLNINFIIERYSFLFTLLCFLLFSNALNMFDGINLQCIFFSLASFIYLNIVKYDFFILCIILTLFFLAYKNFKNLTFLGNSGSYLVSFLISYQIIFFYNQNIINNVEEIFILLMIPGVDMLRLFFFRIFNKKNPFKADKNHLHHILLTRYGYKVTITMITILLVFNLILLKLDINKLIIILLFISVYTSLIIFCSDNKKINI